MIPGIVSSAGLQAGKKTEIEIKRLRDAAADIRSRASKGSYDDQDLRQFWRLTETAGPTLGISNPDLAKMAGLGDGFFSSVSKDRRRPKLVNLLRALTAIVEAADERFLKSDATANASSYAITNSRLNREHHELLKLAVSLERMARDQIDILSNERPNDPATIEANEKQRELLVIFAEGFGRIATALSELARKPDESLMLSKARGVVESVGDQVNVWWKANANEAVDWSLRLPFFIAGVAGLGWAGANMTIATSAVAALVGGSKVVKAIKDSKKSD